MRWILSSASKTGYNHLLAQPRFVDKFAGLPVVRNLTELREVVSPAHRTWVVFAPYANFEKLSSPSVLDYLNQNGKVEFETYRAKVMLVERAKQPEECRQNALDLDSGIGPVNSFSASRTDRK